MRILIVRHGDPNYELDTLTPKGWHEAELLADKLSKENIDAFFVSPLGRARDTAAVTLRRMGRESEAVTCGWLREFDARMPDPYTGEIRAVAWDLLPDYWTPDERFFDRNRWVETDYSRSGDIEQRQREVAEGIDGILSDFGYERDGNMYRTGQGNDKTIALFCHLGVQCVMLGHLLGISPYVLWHGFCAAPTSVTTLYTEERRKGRVFFRLREFGSTEHLYVGGETPSWSGAFCTVYENLDQRHD